jgi:hypothetical protein
MTCWKTERHERPTFATLRKELSTYQRNATSDSIRDIGQILHDAKQ